LATELPVAFLDLGQDLLISSIKGWLPAEQNIQDDSNAPQIALLVVLALENLGSNIVWGSVHLVHLVIVFTVDLRGAKVDNFDAVSIVRVNKQILRF
jgi:hypothetical protein